MAETQSGSETNPTEKSHLLAEFLRDDNYMFALRRISASETTLRAAAHAALNLALDEYFADYPAPNP